MSTWATSRLRGAVRLLDQVGLGWLDRDGHAGYCGERLCHGLLPEASLHGLQGGVQPGQLGAVLRGLLDGGLLLLHHGPGGV